MAGLFSSPHGSPTKKDLEDVGLSCEVCMEAYSTPPSLKIPKALHCLHTFCLDCCSKIQRPSANGGAATEIECPSCRKITVLDEGVDSLMNNFALLRVLDMISLNTAVAPTEGDKAAVCDVCTAAASASHYCAECGEYLCTDCAGIHLRMRATAEHQVRSLAQLQDEGGLASLRGRRIMCRKHPREELRVWCDTCEELICRDCTLLDHPRPEHSFVFAEQAVEAQRAQLLQRLQEVREVAAAAREAMAGLSSAEEAWREEDRTALTGLEERFSQLRAALASREEVLREEGEAFIAAKHSAAAAQRQLLELFVRSAENCVHFVETATASSGSYEFLAAKQRMDARLQEVLAEQGSLCVAVPPPDPLFFADDHPALVAAINAACPRQRASHCLSLSRGVLSAVSDDDPEAPPPAAGVQYGQSLQGLLQQGWQVHYHQPYSHATSLGDLDPGRGEWLLVAARKKGLDELLLGAAGRREEVLRRTSGMADAHESNGAFWYCWEGKAFGFAGSARVTLSAADTERSEAESRLSWHVNGGAGWRAGRETHLGEDVSTDCFEKIVLFRT